MCRLLKVVTRTFYDTSSVLLVDLILYYGSLSINEAECLLHLSQVQLQSTIRRLSSEYLIRVHDDGETVGSSDFMDKATLYIDYELCYGVIRFKLNEVHKSLESQFNEQPKIFSCARCQRGWTALEAWLDGDALVCENCGVELSLHKPEEMHQIDERKRAYAKDVADLSKMLKDVEQAGLRNVA